MKTKKLLVLVHSKTKSPHCSRFIAATNLGMEIPRHQEDFHDFGISIRLLNGDVYAIGWSRFFFLLLLSQNLAYLSQPCLFRFHKEDAKMKRLFE